MHLYLHGWDENCPAPFVPKKRKGPTGESSDPVQTPRQKRDAEVAEEGKDLEGRRPEKKKLQ